MRWGGGAGGPVVVIALMMSLIQLTMPARISRTGPLEASASAIAAALLFSLAPIFPDHSAGTPPVASNNLLLWLIGVAALICFSLWWLVGRQERLVPWIAFVVIAAAAFALLAMGESRPATAGLTGFAGYLLCAVVRLVRAFATATTMNERRGLW